MSGSPSKVHTHPAQPFTPALAHHTFTGLHETFGKIVLAHIWRAVAANVRKVIEPRDKVLDVCCGSGNVLEMIKGANRTGIDIDPKQIAKANRKVKDPSLRFITASADALPLEDHSVDAAISTLGFHHLPPEVKKKAFEEIRRVLKKGAPFFLCDLSYPNDPFIAWIVSKIHSREPEAGAQMLERDFYRLAKEVGFTLQTLQTFYGCVCLHAVQFLEQSEEESMRPAASLQEPRMAA